MNDRIHAWLDGELPFEALTPQEQAEARAVERAVQAVSEQLTHTAAPDLRAPVMSRLASAPAQPAAVRPAQVRRRTVRAWLHDAIPAGGFGLRPAAALATFSLLIGFALGSLLTGDARSGLNGAMAGIDATAAAPQVFVRFELEAADVSDVRLAGSFTGWEADIEMTPVGDGLWRATVPLEPGVHDYVFILDGDRHVIDPYAPRVADGFGGYSSRLALLDPGS